MIIYIDYGNIILCQPLAIHLIHYRFFISFCDLIQKP